MNKPTGGSRVGRRESSPTLGAIEEPESWWQKDEEVNQCTRCRFAFSVSKRKHHCRACGKIFCSDCSSQRARLPSLGYPEKVRVCDECAHRYLNSDVYVLAENLDANAEMAKKLKEALSDQTKQIERFRGFLLTVESEYRDIFIDDHSSYQNSYGAHMSFDTLLERSKEHLAAIRQRLDASRKEKEELQAVLNEKADCEEALRSELAAEKQKADLAETSNARSKSLERELEHLSLALHSKTAELVTSNTQLDNLRQRCQRLEMQITSTSIQPRLSATRGEEMTSSSRARGTADNPGVVTCTLSGGLDESFLHVDSEGVGGAMPGTRLGRCCGRCCGRRMRQRLRVRLFSWFGI